MNNLKKVKVMGIMKGISHRVAKRIMNILGNNL